jgi:A/G-specific adenine glycosylase
VEGSLAVKGARTGAAGARGGAGRPHRPGRPASAASPPPSLSRVFGRRLLAWWDRERLQLPWRRNRTPYSVWVAEVMLQQTVVKAVIPHWIRWMAELPDIAALAAADEQKVTRLWEGLGYYSRARNLLAAARAARDRWGGELPLTYDGMRALPGVGDYTARAVLSIAAGARLAVVDANVRRIVARLGAARAAPADAAVQAALEAVMPGGRAGDFNEALMELGQRVCTARDPRCGECPLARGCAARAAGLQREIPARARAVATARRSIAMLLLRGDRVLLCPHGGGLFRGLWTFPRAPADAAAAARPLAELPPRTHSYTRYRERLLPRIYEAGKGDPPCPGEWVPLAEIEERPMPSTHRRIARDLLAWAEDAQPGRRATRER